MRLRVRKSRLPWPGEGPWRVEIAGASQWYLATFATHRAALNFALWKVGAQRNYAEVSG